MKGPLAKSISWDKNPFFLRTAIIFAFRCGDAVPNEDFANFVLKILRGVCHVEVLKLRMSILEYISPAAAKPGCFSTMFYNLKSLRVSTGMEKIYLQSIIYLLKCATNLQLLSVYIDQEMCEYDNEWKIPDEDIACLTCHLKMVKLVETDKAENKKKIDRISNFPDAILLHILSFLESIEVVKTSVLAKKWRLSLENLILERCVYDTVKVLDISAGSLKTLAIENAKLDIGLCGTELKIFVLNLLSFKNGFEDKSGKHSGYLFSELIRNFSNTKFMILSAVFPLLCEAECFPLFYNLMFLKVYACVSKDHLQDVVHLLKYSPDLEALVIDFKLLQSTSAVTHNISQAKAVEQFCCMKI
ncbi:hypothetical protein CRYUN_Cryun01aG0252400 [Craigia yunnanensis]